MLIPIIRIKDGDGEPRIVGTDSHDTLHVDDETGGIQYLNLQCCEGTKKYASDASFKFVGETNEYSPYEEIQFVTFEELAQIYLEQVKMSCDSRKRMKAFVEGILKNADMLLDRED